VCKKALKYKIDGKAVNVKKTALIFLLTLIYAGAYAQALDEFTAKADNTGKVLAVKQAELKRIKVRYEYTAKKIDELKAEKEKGGINGALSSMKLSYYLQSGNKTGYRQYILNSEINSLRDERFTYIMIIIDEYTKQLKECFKTKCGRAKELFSEREKWMGALDEYRDILQIDFDLREMIGSLKTEAKDDLKKYLEGKAVQADERLYLLKEEKNILKDAAAAGINADGKTGAKNSAEITELEKMRKKIEVMLEGMK
jgi:hypothetical protein